MLRLELGNLGSDGSGEGDNELLLIVGNGRISWRRLRPVTRRTARLLLDMDLAPIELRRAQAEIEPLVQLTDAYPNLLRRWAGR